VAEELSILEAVVLGVVQGLTEWLPVSSSGHLVLVQHYLDVEVTLFFDVLLHVATLGVIVLFYRETIRDVLVALARVPRDRRDGASWRAIWWDTPPRRLAVLVVVGSAATASLALPAEELLRDAFASTLVVGIALIATGTWLFAARFAPPVDPDRPGLWDGLLIGLAQGTAFVPGVSRSGATIGMALLRGVEREHAVRFSFLLSVPAIVGATVYEANTAAVGSTSAWPTYLVGMAVAALVGYAALWLLVRIVERRGFTHFCWYCWALGAATVALALS